jgi:endonuclease/exonuclease/phosphatase (EEP) superfamily protein YafD
VTQRGERPLPDRHVRIVSANLWNGAVDPRAFADLIERLEPDAVATQEMSPEQAEALARVLPHGLLEPSRDFMGMGIALRDPAPVRRLGLPCRDARVTEIRCERSGTRLELELLNVHIQAPHVARSWGTLRSRGGQLRGLVRHLEAAPQRRRVLVGDLNATPLWPLYRRLAARLTDAAVLAARHHGRAVERTWGPWPGGPRLLRLDHALVHGVAVDDFQVLPLPGGDHCAIVVDVAMPIAALELAGAGQRAQRAG